MSLCIAIYTKQGFQEVILPNIDNANYRIKLGRQPFGLQEETEILLEVLKGKWNLCGSGEYRICTEDLREELSFIEDLEKKPGKYLIVAGRGEHISLMISVMTCSLRPSQKVYIGDTSEVSIGRNADCTISLQIPNKSSCIYAMIQKQNGGFVISCIGKSSVYLNGQLCESAAVLRFGDQIRFPEVELVFLKEYLAVDFKTSGGSTRLTGRKPFKAVFAFAEREDIYYHRAPRRIEVPVPGVVDIDAPPREREQDNKNMIMSIGPQLTMVLPMLMGFMLMRTSAYMQNRSGLYMYSGIAMTGTSAALSIIWNLVGRSREKNRRTGREDLIWQKYTEYLSAIDEELQCRSQEYLSIRKKQYPELQNRLKALEDGSLWERNRSHEDFLLQRIGTGDQPSPIEIRIPKEKFEIYEDKLRIRPMQIAETYKTIQKCPILLDLSKYRIVGIVDAIRKEGASGIAEMIAAQAAVNNCYTDVKIAVFYDGENPIEKEYWEFARWLPHVWSIDRRIRYIATDRQSISDVSYEFSKIYEERAETSEKNEEKFIPHYLVFVTSEKLIEDELIMKLLSENAKNSGITMLIMADQIYKLPNSCDVIIENTDSFQGIHYIGDYETDPQQVTFDMIARKSLERFSRSISGIRIREQGGEGEIPSAISFLELFGAREVQELRSEIRWLKNRTVENIRGPIGALNGDRILYLDLHEKYHGPHGLIAGTTGSGKSEILQTLILSLAVNYSPEDISFLLIDYKGGGMADLFSDLPHISGSISNLSGNQVRRAMISIKSENLRRQRILKKYRVNNINSYTGLYKKGAAAEVLPHLVIVIDEFAELRREEPEFMKELISVAQVGRSLGVHLILATQKPGGTVDDNIRSNSRFKICLRVQDRQDSIELLKRPDAAYLTSIGRGYLQVGNDELFEEFQSGYSGEYYEKTQIDSKCVQMLTDTGERICCGAPERKDKAAITQLHAVCTYLKETAKKEHTKMPAALWLPVLKPQILLEELDMEYSYDRCQMPEFRAGLVDDPSRQRQFPLVVRLIHSGNIMILGSVGSGKSTILQTMLYDLIHRYSPNKIQFYCLDFSSHFLFGFQNARHMSACLSEEDTDSIGRMFFRLREELEKRKKLLKGASFQQFFRESRSELPLILLCIDGYAAFREKTEEQYENTIMKLLKEGVRYGIMLVISGASVTSNDIPPRIAGIMETVFCLYMQDRYIYNEAFHTTGIEVFPDRIHGRGLVKLQGSVFEFQAAVSVKAEDDYQRIKKLKEACNQINQNFQEIFCDKLPVIPHTLRYRDFVKELESREAAKRYKIPIGYEFESGYVYWLDLSRSYSLMITGEMRSGKRNFLRLLIKECSFRKFEICIIDPGSSVGLQNTHSTILQSDEEIADWFTEYLFPIFRQRNQQKQKMEKEGKSEKEIIDEIQNTVPILVAITDMGMFLENLCKKESVFAAHMENIFDKGENHNICFAVVLSVEEQSKFSNHPVWKKFRKRKQGLHFGGCVNKNSCMDFADLPYKEQIRTRKPGFGMVPAGDSSEHTNLVIVPLLEKDDG